MADIEADYVRQYLSDWLARGGLNGSRKPFERTSFLPGQPAQVSLDHRGLYDFEWPRWSQKGLSQENLSYLSLYDLDSPGQFGEVLSVVFHTQLQNDSRGMFMGGDPISYFVGDVGVPVIMRRQVDLIAQDRAALLQGLNANDQVRVAYFIDYISRERTNRELIVPDGTLIDSKQLIKSLKEHGFVIKDDGKISVGVKGEMKLTITEGNTTHNTLVGKMLTLDMEDYSADRPSRATLRIMELGKFNLRAGRHLNYLQNFVLGPNGKLHSLLTGHVVDIANPHISQIHDILPDLSMIKEPLKFYLYQELGLKAADVDKLYYQYLVTTFSRAVFNKVRGVNPENAITPVAYANYDTWVDEINMMHNTYGVLDTESYQKMIFRMWGAIGVNPIGFIELFRDIRLGSSVYELFPNLDLAMGEYPHLGKESMSKWIDFASRYVVAEHVIDENDDRTASQYSVPHWYRPESIHIPKKTVSRLCLESPARLAAQNEEVDLRNLFGPWVIPELIKSLGTLDSSDAKLFGSNPMTYLIWLFSNTKLESN